MACPRPVGHGAAVAARPRSLQRHTLAIETLRRIRAVASRPHRSAADYPARRDIALGCARYLGVALLAVAYHPLGIDTQPDVCDAVCALFEPRHRQGKSLAIGVVAPCEAT